MKNLIIFIFTIITPSIVYQDDSNDLIGKWECYHIELEDGTTKATDPFSGEVFVYTCNGQIIELKPDLTGYESRNGLIFSYKRKDSILSLGNREYIIEKLTQTELIIRDYNSDKLNVSNFRKMFNKIKV